jgi:hypothetical protein
MILDSGYGVGPSIVGAFKVDACRVTGIDPAHKMLGLVRQRLYEQAYRKTDVRHRRCAQECS